MSSVKEEIQKLAEKLPPDATWEQAMYELYVRQKIAGGRHAVSEGRVVPPRGSQGTPRPGIKLAWSAPAHSQLVAIQDYLTQQVALSQSLEELASSENRRDPEPT
jgi:hypothetical protein